MTIVKHDALVLRVKCSAEALKKLHALWQSGKLDRLLGYTVLAIKVADETPESSSAHVARSSSTALHIEVTDANNDLRIISLETDSAVPFLLGKQDRAVRARIVKKYWRDLETCAASICYSFALSRADQEDILEAAVEGLMTAIDMFDPEKGNARNWAFKQIYQNARSRAGLLKRRRSFERNMVHSLSVDEETKVAQPYPHSQDHEETRLTLLTDELDSKLLSLRAEHRYVLYTHYYEGITLSKIAKRMDVPVEVVRQWLQKGQSRLANLLKNIK